MEKTFAKGLTLLETMVAFGEPTSVTRLANALGLYKSNVHRLLRTLVSAGYVAQIEDGRYMPTLLLAEIGEAVWTAFDLAPLVDPHLAAMAAETGRTTALLQVERNALRTRSFALAGARAPAAPGLIPLPQAARRLAGAEGAAIIVTAPDGQGGTACLTVAALPDLRLPAPLAVALVSAEGAGDPGALVRALADRLSDALSGRSSQLAGREVIPT